MLSPSKYTKKNLRNLLHLRKSARREATTHRAEVKGEAFAKISSVVALQARSDKRKSESLGGKSKSLETKSNRVEVKSNRVEVGSFYAIRFLFLRNTAFFLVPMLPMLPIFSQDFVVKYRQHRH